MIEINFSNSLGLYNKGIEKTKEDTEMTKVVMKLDELSCPSCMEKIQAAMIGTKGVTTAKVLFNASKVKAEFDENVVTADELVAKVEKLGYPVLSSKVTALA